MKTLSNGYQVTARSYYYLLDWNDSENNKTMVELFGKNSLNELNEMQYAMLFQYATNIDYTNL